jgi:hypothetical protein
MRYRNTDANKRKMNMCHFFMLQPDRVLGRESAIPSTPLECSNPIKPPTQPGGKQKNESPL